MVGYTWDMVCVWICKFDQGTYMTSAQLFQFTIVSALTEPFFSSEGPKSMCKYCTTLVSILYRQICLTLTVENS